MFTISWFPKPWKPVFIIVYTKCLKKYKKIWKHLWKILFFISQLFENPQFWHFSKRRAPTNDEDPHKQISKILDMYFISIKNMKWKFGNMYKISSDNIKPFWNQETFLFSSKGIIQYYIADSKGIHENHLTLISR